MQSSPEVPKEELDMITTPLTLRKEKPFESLVLIISLY